MKHSGISVGSKVQLTGSAAERYGMSASDSMTVTAITRREGYITPWIWVGEWAFRPSDLRASLPLVDGVAQSVTHARTLLPR